MSFANAHPLVPIGDSRRAQKIEICQLTKKVKRMSIFT